MEYLYRTEVLPRFLRIDKGTETGKMATIQTYLMSQFGVMDDPLHSVIYGPSTTNKIERWWRDLHEKLERYFKEQLNMLLRGREYDPHDLTDRQLLAYVYLPIVQRECEIFENYWNSHRIRNQEKLEIPTEVSGVMDADMFGYMDENIATQCSQYLPNVGTVTCKDAIDAYRFVKSKVV